MTESTGDRELDRLGADLQGAIEALTSLMPRVPAAIAFYKRMADGAGARAEAFRLQLGERERLLAAQVSAIAALRDEVKASADREAETARRMTEMQERADMNRGPADEASDMRRELAFAGRGKTRF